jgi:hypothetical protein
LQRCCCSKLFYCSTKKGLMSFNFGESCFASANTFPQTNVKFMITDYKTNSKVYNRPSQINSAPFLETTVSFHCSQLLIVKHYLTQLKATTSSHVSPLFYTSLMFLKWPVVMNEVKIGTEFLLLSVTRLQSYPMIRYNNASYFVGSFVTLTFEISLYQTNITKRSYLTPFQ